MSLKNRANKLSLNQTLSARQKAFVQEVALIEKTQKDLEVALDIIRNLSDDLEHARQKLNLVKHLCQVCSAHSFRPAVEEVVKDVA